MTNQTCAHHGCANRPLFGSRYCAAPHGDDDEPTTIPNPLEMTWEERLAWYDGLGAAMGLVALVAWMHSPPLCCDCLCSFGDIVDAYELLYDDGVPYWNKRSGEPWCSACAEANGLVVVSQGADPHLLPPAAAAEDDDTPWPEWGRL